MNNEHSFDEDIFSDSVKEENIEWLSKVLFGLGFQDLLRERAIEAFNESGISVEFIDDILEEIIFSARDNNDLFTAQTAESLRVLIKAILGKPVFPWDPTPDMVINRIMNFFSSNEKM